MRIIPVMDLTDGRVVHAVKGERDKYQPVKSLLTSGSRPVEVAKALIDETMCREIYIADLDAIQKKGHNWQVIIELAEKLDVILWVDAGISEGASAGKLKTAGAGKIIIGSETLTSTGQLDSIREAIPEGDLIFSIDISRGRIISESGSLRGAEPITAMRDITSKGVDHFILLTFDMVGTGRGPNIKLIKRAREEFPSHTIIAGGGVQTPEHLDGLKEAGASAVLVATSLHKGWITREDIIDM
jgi:phosphoribosylformimino-5-aminoimidazole carboxamide ribotide isomerase